MQEQDEENKHDYGLNQMTNRTKKYSHILQNIISKNVSVALSPVGLLWF